MNINIQTKNIELTNELNSIIREKVGLLEKFIPSNNKDQVALAEVEVGKETEHHNKGEDLYRAEINLTLNKRMLRTVSLKSDIYAALDDAQDQMQIRITSHSSKVMDMIRRGARKAKDMLRFRGPER